MVPVVTLRPKAAPAPPEPGHAGILALADVDPQARLRWQSAPGTLSPHECHDSAIEGLIARASSADPEGPEHARRVGLMAAELATYFQVPTERRRLLQRAAELHDIGKLALPDAILGYRHVLDTTRRRVVEQHALFGAAMLAGAREPYLRLARSIALCHHERWDGTGYPAGLSGEAIPLAARLVMVADVYDALRSVRSYKAAMPHDEAMRRLLEGDDRIRPSHFDPAVLTVLPAASEAFERIHEEVRDLPRRRGA